MYNTSYYIFFFFFLNFTREAGRGEGQQVKKVITSLTIRQDRKNPMCDCLGQVHFALGWSGGVLKLASVVLLEVISNQKQFQNLRLQDEQNNELKA